MPTILSTAAVERSTYVITAAFTDHAGAPTIPVTLTWKLTDGAGAIVNGRSAVVVTPAESVSIVLSGADLALPNRGDALRTLTLSGTYNSTLGSGLPIADQVQFMITDLEAI